MARTRKKSPSRAKRKNSAGFFSIRRALFYFFLASLTVFSVFAATYVIFFRTVFAQDLVISTKREVVFEEPDPPVHAESTVESGEEGITVTEKLPKVAIIIDDLGYHQKIGDQFLKFPYELTYSFLPFAPYTAKQEKLAFYSGKTVLLHLPMQPKGEQWDPGPGALFLSDPPEIQIKKFKQDLAAVPHAMGVNNHMGSLFSADSAAMRRVLTLVKENGLFFVDSFTTADSVGLETAQNLELSVARRHIFLDNERLEEKICEQLDKLIKVAEIRGFAIGIAHPYPETYRALEDCVPKYANRVKFTRVDVNLMGCMKIKCED